MNDLLNHKYFLFISPKKVCLAVLDSKNEVVFKKESLTDDSSIDKNFLTIENFLKKNIFSIEKSLNKYVKDINLILDYVVFFSANLSSRYNFKGTQFNLDNLNNTLIDIRNQFKKTISEHEIIHMMIDRYIIDGNTHLSLPEHNNYKDLSLEIRFICLQNSIIKDLERTISKYQISLNKIVCSKYLREFKSLNTESIYFKANSILGGYNQNEIFMVNKSTKNKGFFEKFFNFFN